VAKRGDAQSEVDAERSDGVPPKKARSRRQGQRKGIWQRAWRGAGSLLLIVVAAAVVLPPMFGTPEFDRAAWLNLVRAGGGEVRWLGGHTTCYPFPELPRSGRGRPSSYPVSVGTRVDVVAREGEWALIDRFGNPCWVPDWVLQETQPDMRQMVTCGMACHRRAPEGWYEAQRVKLCESNAFERFSCWARAKLRDGGA